MEAQTKSRPPVRLIANRRIKYGGIVYDKGDEFNARHTHSKWLVALNKAKRAGPLPELAPVNEPLTNDRAKLRAEYMRLYGKRPFMGWDEAELKTRIARYDRRDMRAAK